MIQTMHTDYVCRHISAGVPDVKSFMLDISRYRIAKDYYHLPRQYFNDAFKYCHYPDLPTVGLSFRFIYRNIMATVNIACP